MRTYDFINSNIGNKVYITSDGDLAMDGSLRKFIFNKTEFTLLRLTKGGMAILCDENGKEYLIPPKNVRKAGY